MRIERKKSSTVQFGKLHNGDLFVFENRVCLKLKSGHQTNAADIYTGEHLNFLDTHEVVNINGKFVEE